VIQVGLIVGSSNVTGAGRLLRGASLSLLAKFRRFRNADRRLRPSWPADLAKNGEFSVSGCKASANPRNSRALFWRPGDQRIGPTGWLTTQFARTGLKQNSELAGIFAQIAKRSCGSLVQ
jgi:hypothetical protein